MPWAVNNQRVVLTLGLRFTQPQWRPFFIFE
jgi:hypothetical protein